ncbi:MAG: hypothetical protein FWB75_04285 [Oscillospiraceae bacterium]|nr:hypothetical protein [Oscillospiraceae bacterium]
MKKIIWIALAGVVLLIFIWVSLFFVEPVFSRKSYIESLTRFEIPQSAEIIEYRFGVSHFGAEPFFAKLELNQEDAAVLFGRFLRSEERLQKFSHMSRRFNYTSISVHEVEEIVWNDRFARKSSMFLFSGTRTIETIIITTNEGRHFLYVFYGQSVNSVADCVSDEDEVAPDTK